LVHFLPELYTSDPSQILPKWTSTLWELFLRELDLPSDRRGFREANLDLAFWNISSVFDDFRLIRIESKSALRYLWLQSKDKEGERGKQTWEVLKWPQFIAILRRWFDANKMPNKNIYKKIIVSKMTSFYWNFKATNAFCLLNATFVKFVNYQNDPIYQVRRHFKFKLKKTVVTKIFL